MLPGLFDAMGGVRYNAIRQLLEDYGVVAGERAVIHDRVLALVGVIREIREHGRKT